MATVERLAIAGGRPILVPEQHRSWPDVRQEDREAIMAVLDRLHAEGNTIVLVTHEHDIAEYAHRIISIRDGVVAKDEKKR